MHTTPNLRSRLLPVILVCSVVAFAAVKLQAGEVRVRNESNQTIHVAIAYHWHYVPSENGDDERVQGFYAIKPNETKTIASYPASADYGNTRLSEAWLHINQAGRIWRPQGRTAFVMGRESLKKLSNSQTSWWIVKPDVEGNLPRHFNIDPASPVFGALRRDDALVFYRTTLKGGGVKTFRYR